MLNVVVNTLSTVVGQYVLGSFLMLLAVTLIVLVLFQTSKEKGLSGTITGSAETFFGKSKAGDKDALLSKLTIIVSALFVAGVIAMTILLVI